MKAFLETMPKLLLILFAILPFAALAAAGVGSERLAKILGIGMFASGILILILLAVLAYMDNEDNA